MSTTENDQEEKAVSVAPPTVAPDDEEEEQIIELAERFVETKDEQTVKRTEMNITREKVLEFLQETGEKELKIGNTIFELSERPVSIKMQDIIAETLKEHYDFTEEDLDLLGDRMQEKKEEMMTEYKTVLKIRTLKNKSKIFKKTSNKKNNSKKRKQIRRDDDDNPDEHDQSTTTEQDDSKSPSQSKPTKKTNRSRSMSPASRRTNNNKKQRRSISPHMRRVQIARENVYDREMIVSRTTEK